MQGGRPTRGRRTNFLAYGSIIISLPCVVKKSMPMTGLTIFATNAENVYSRPRSSCRTLHRPSALIFSPLASIKFTGSREVLLTIEACPGVTTLCDAPVSTRKSPAMIWTWGENEDNGVTNMLGGATNSSLARSLRFPTCYFFQKRISPHNWESKGQTH